MKGKFIAAIFQSGLLLGLFLMGNQNAFSGSEVVELLPKPNLYILSIGIDKYQNAPNGISFKFAKADATAIADEFEKRGVNNFGIIEKKVLLDERATQSEIIAAFEDLALKAKSNDVFIFNFAGLGSSHVLKGTEFYLFTADAKLDSIEQTGISSGRLQSFFRKIRAQTKLIILDSCDSSIGFESTNSAFVEQDKNIASLIDENVLFIGTDTTTPESLELGHGVLTAIVLDGLRGEADCNGDGTVTNYELVAQMYNGSAKYEKKLGLKTNPRTVTRGKIFALGATDKKLEEIAAREKADKKKNGTTAKNELTVEKPEADPMRSKAIPFGKRKEAEDSRKGDDYAILFANDVYDNTSGWAKLKNPQNDVTDIARELKERYGFKEVEIKRNLTTQEIYETIDIYQSKIYENPMGDQLFIYFAGHGFADKYNKGFYVGRDSPATPTRQNESQFVALDSILTAIDRIELQHIMVVFDACYAGQIWKPALQPIITASIPSKTRNYATVEMLPISFGNIGKSNLNFSFPLNNTNQISKQAFAKRKMKIRSRIILTSGDAPVFDAWRKADGSLSSNSPFADAFLEALKTNGDKDEVLTSNEIIPFIDKLEVEPQRGILSASDGEFVFVLPDKK